MTETLTTLDALRRAILANPEDDIVRGAYADALDEEAGGYSERAEFIRVQCELTKIKSSGGKWSDTVFNQGDSCECKTCQLRRREWELWNFGATGTWVEGIKPEFDCIQCIDVETISTDTAHIPILVYRRGFVSEVRAPMSVLIGEACERCGGTGWHGGRWPRQKCPACSGTGRTVGVLPGIVQREPVVKVVATDREPEHYTDSHTPYGWRMWNPSQTPTQFDIPEDIWHLIQGAKSSRPRSELTGYGWVVSFDSPDLAHSALSAALLAWGKAGARAC